MFFSALTQKRMQELGMTKKQLSDITGLPYMTVSNIISRGAANAGTQNVLRICAPLGIEVDDLFELIELPQMDHANPSDSPTAKWGEMIKVRRKALGMSAEELAEKTGIAPATIYRYENGSTNTPKMSMLKKISTVLGIDILQCMEQADAHNITCDIGSGIHTLNPVSAIPSANSINTFNRLIQAITTLYWQLPQSEQVAFSDNIVSTAFQWNGK